ncbi:MAG TPA: hypothetical protein VHK91_12915 [Flavisolibacter sp.]|jgi:hypothetical protein|nr:hypothetical protein [Flavisolibacter sp.]
MDIQLISGVFTLAEAEALLTEIIAVKIRFHENKIRTIHDTEEDIKHSEKRIIQLQERLQKALQKMREAGKENMVLNAKIEISTHRQLTP